MMDIDSKLKKLFDCDDVVASDGFYHVNLTYGYSYEDRDNIKADMLSKLNILKNNYKFYVLVDHTCSHNPGRQDHKDHTLVYQFLNLESHYRLQISVALKYNEFMISFREVWPSVTVMEEELNKSFGIQYFISRQDNQLERFDKGNTPMRKGKSYQQDLNGEKAPRPTYVMPLKPSSLESHLEWKSYGPFDHRYSRKQRMDVLINEEEGYVEEGHLTFGFYKRNIEKNSEKLNVFELELMLMRFSSEHSLFYSLLFAETIEKMSLITVPVKAQVLRMVLCEVVRVRSHLNNMTKFLSMLGFDFEANLIRQSLVYVYKVERYYGQTQQFHSPFLIGGLRNDIPDGWVTEFFNFSKELTHHLTQVKDYVYRHPDMITMCQQKGISASEALDYALTGPSLRSCGVNYDLRKKQSNYLYDDIDFDVPLGINGTNYDRFIVRVEETFQSLSMIHQLLNSIPRGPIYNREHAYHRPYLKSQKQDPTSRSYYGQNVPDLPVGELYHYLEGPEGEIGLYLTSKGKDTPYRFHLRSPSTFHGQVFPKLTKSLSKQNCFVSLMSLNIDSWEVDR
jgi:NADH:ubiquinone oxidoreductase subunit D/NADH:ubiquinone oxidoreductase subunit C